MSNKSMNFEDSLKRIEEIVSILENGNTTLDQSVKLFEEATNLCALCNRKLENAEQKVKKIALNYDEENANE